MFVICFVGIVWFDVVIDKGCGGMLMVMLVSLVVGLLEIVDGSV